MPHINTIFLIIFVEKLCVLSREKMFTLRRRVPEPRGRGTELRKQPIHFKTWSRYLLLDEFYNRFVTCELRDRRKMIGVNEDVYINIRKFVAVLKEFGGKSLEN